MRYTSLIIILGFFIIELSAQDTTVLELPKNQVTWLKSMVETLTSDIPSNSYSSRLQGLVDIVHINTNEPDKLKEELKSISSLEILKERYPQAEVHKNQISSFEESTDTLQRETIKAIIEFTDFLFIPNYTFVDREIFELKQNRFWLVKSLKSYDEEYDQKVLGVFISDVPKKVILPDILQESINYFNSLIKDTPNKQEFKYTNQPVRINIDTLTKIQKKDYLNYALRTKVSSFCGQDNSSMTQEILIYHLSAELGEWGIFIRSLLNIVSDNVARASDDPRSSAAREKYYYNISKLGIEPWKFLLGQEIKYSESNKKGILISRSIIPALLFDMDIERYYKDLIKLITNQELDYVNRYSLLRLASVFVKYSKDEDQYNKLIKDLEKSIDSLPPEIQKIICQRIFGRETARC